MGTQDSALYEQKRCYEENPALDLFSGVTVIESMRLIMLSGLSGLRGAAFAGILLSCGGGTACAVERSLTIDAPSSVKVGQEVSLTIEASTDARGEQIGFLQVEFSIDGGKTWEAICYLQNSGPRVVQPAQLKPGSEGSVVEVRARAAFRDGLAGDVDYRGAAILWQGDWKVWETPPAKRVVIQVTPQ